MIEQFTSREVERTATMLGTADRVRLRATDERGAARKPKFSGLALSRLVSLGLAERERDGSVKLTPFGLAIRQRLGGAGK